jgi:hypothetical protein
VGSPEASHKLPSISAAATESSRHCCAFWRVCASIVSAAEQRINAQKLGRDKTAMRSFFVEADDGEDKPAHTLNNLNADLTLIGDRDLTNVARRAADQKPGMKQQHERRRKNPQWSRRSM